VKISSIAPESGTALQPAASTKRVASTDGQPAISSDSTHRQSEQLISAAALATTKARANSGEAGDAATPIVNGFNFSLQRLEFSFDKETGRQIIRVVDAVSGKMIWQIPAEEALNFLRHVEERKGALLSMKS
jgi:flagellar protein FlaG